MLNLDEPVKITAGTKVFFEGKLDRTIAELESTLAERGDPDLIFSAQKQVEIDF